jgi:hypothetical protein
MRFSAVVAPRPSDCRAIAYGLDAVVSGTAFQVPAWDETQASANARWAPASLLHLWKGSSNALTAAFQRSTSGPARTARTLRPVLSGVAASFTSRPE